MRHDDPLAKNLLARLFSYTPREGREPLEDFCTETLAWCLRANSEFCKNFLHLFGLEYQPDLKIETQLVVDGKRLDLTISSYQGSFLVILENKVWSNFGYEQLQNYRKIINQNQQFQKFAKRYVMTITPFHDKPLGADDHCAWSKIQECLIVFENHGNREFEFVCSWFAEFLANHGLKPMKIKTQKIQDYFEVFQLRHDMENFLKGLRLATGQIKFISDKAGLWLGAYLNDNRFWVGFQLDKSSKTIYVHAECFLAGERQKLFESLKANADWGSQLFPDEGLVGGCFDPESQKTWIRFHKPLREDFCTDDKMRDWFTGIVAFMNDLDNAG